MLVRLTVSLSGTRNGQPWPARNSVMELPDDEGADMCSAGMAVPVPEDKVEKAVEPPAEERAEPATEPAEAVKGGDDMDALYAQASELGIKVDGRWGAARLREEIAKATPAQPADTTEANE